MVHAVFALDQAWDSLWRAEVTLRAAEALAREAGDGALASDAAVLRMAVAAESEALHEVIRRRTHGSGPSADR